MNTTENNKLLAEFLGFELSHKIERVPNNKIFKEHINLITNNADNLPFHNDWNWLMKVAERIETVETKDGRTFTIDMHRDSVLIFEYGITTNIIVFTKGKGRLENLYNACIEFVKWWNKEQMDSAGE